jgi:hypothetical protein
MEKSLVYAGNGSLRDTVPHGRAYPEEKAAFATGGLHTQE